jgi:hypothetical protein
VRLVGRGPAAFWTRRALERAGYTLSTSTGALAEVAVLGALGSYQWALNGVGAAASGTTVAALLAALQAALTH